jgi:hypothetical protein
MTCQWVNKTHRHAFMFESFDNFCGSCRFVNFPNFNSLVYAYAESESIRRDPLKTDNLFLTFEGVEIKWPLVDRAGIEEENFFRYKLNKIKLVTIGETGAGIVREGRMRRVHINTSRFEGGGGNKNLT